MKEITKKELLEIYAEKGTKGVAKKYKITIPTALKYLKICGIKPKNGRPGKIKVDKKF